MLQTIQMNPADSAKAPSPAPSPAGEGKQLRVPLDGDGRIPTIEEVRCGCRGTGRPRSWAIHICPLHKPKLRPFFDENGLPLVRLCKKCSKPFLVMQGGYLHQRVFCSRACGIGTHKQSRRDSGRKSPEYSVWCSMKARCYNPNEKYFSYYGGRGIKVCDRWLNSFENFLADIGPRPSLKYTIDRHPNQNGDYEPGNCRWATKIQQQNNMRSNHPVTVDGVTMTIAELARLKGVTPACINNRINAGTPLTDPYKPFIPRRRRS